MLQELEAQMDEFVEREMYTEAAELQRIVRHFPLLIPLTEATLHTPSLHYQTKIK